MPDYLLSVRRIRNREFDAEPGQKRFLEVPANRLPTPAHARKFKIDLAAGGLRGGAR